MKTRAAGFTLIEIAIVLVIISVLVTIVAVPLSTQLEQKRFDETQKQLEVVKDALVGFAISNGRLPCPASATSSARESFCSNATGGCGAEVLSYAAAPHGRCFASNGFIPANTLALSPVDAQGYMVDAFLKADNINRIRYAVPAVTVSIVNVGYTAAPAKDYQVFTSTDGMRNTTMDKITAYAAGLLFICQESQAVTTVSITGCGARTELTRASPAVVFSVGSNAEVALGNLSSGGEASNQTPNSVAFFQGSRVDKRGAATPYYFDDLVTWISPNTLFLRMGQAGKLP